MRLLSCRLYLAGTYGLGGASWLGTFLDEALSSRNVCGNLERGGRLDGLLVSERSTFDSDISGRRQRKKGLAASELSVARKERERVIATRKDTFDNDILERGWRSDDMGAIETRGGV